MAETKKKPVAKKPVAKKAAKPAKKIAKKPDDNPAPAPAPAVQPPAEAVEKKEAGIMKDILEKGTYIRPWVDELLKTIGCEIV